MGISASPGVFPVLISGPFYHIPVSNLFFIRNMVETNGIESNSHGATRNVFGRLADIVNDRLVVLFIMSI